MQPAGCPSKRNSNCNPASRTGRRCLLLAVTGLGLLLPTLALAWGSLGHEVAGSIAESYLDDGARREIRALLGRESLAQASHWADRMRSDPSPFWQNEAGPYHYVTAPPGSNYRDLPPPPQGDARTALARFREELRNPDTPRDQRQLALRFAMHIIQDLHQPLHVGNGRDRGGNDVLLTVNGEQSNLHRLWDTELLYSAGRSRRQWLRYFESEGMLREPRRDEDDVYLWIDESAALRDRLYPPPGEVDAAYLRRNLPLAERRLALAGIRTAAWLNATLGGTGSAAPDSAKEPRRWWQRLFR